MILYPKVDWPFQQYDFKIAGGVVIGDIGCAISDCFRCYFEFIPVHGDLNIHDSGKFSFDEKETT